MKALSHLVNRLFRIEDKVLGAPSYDPRLWQLTYARHWQRTAPVRFFAR